MNREPTPNEKLAALPLRIREAVERAQAARAAEARVLAGLAETVREDKP